ncbi:TPA: transketolase C-terminal domain-containing protein, partial [Vibrio cholerae O1]
VVDDGIGLPLDVCFTLRPGRDITVVAWGACIQEVMRAAHLLAEQDIQCEVLDLATIKPLDMESILTSVRKTGRLLVVHEACGSFGVGAEIVSQVTEEAMTALKAPPRRLTGVDAAVP